MIKYRLRQVPIETMEIGKVYLNSVVKTDDKGTVLQGPALIEYNTATYGKEGEWKELEVTT